MLFLFFIFIIPLFIGVLSQLIVRILDKDWNKWYSQIKKAPLSPPNNVFGPAWIVLYLFLGVYMCFLFYTNNHEYFVWYLFSFHLFLNLIWSPLFFGLKTLTFSFLDIALMDLTAYAIFIIEMVFENYYAMLLTPYLLWISFATYLNFYAFYYNEEKKILFFKFFFYIFLFLYANFIKKF